MAQKVTESLVDDLDESPADKTVRFALDGQGYEIDLNGQHEADLRAVFAPYIRNARKKRPVRARAGGRPREDLPDIRAWAEARGHDIKDRGRVPARIVAEYDAVTAGRPAAR